MLHSRAFTALATAVVPFPAAPGRARAQLLMVGFVDGTVRMVLLLGGGGQGWRLTGVLKPHKVPVVALAVAPDGRTAASVAADGGVQFFTVSCEGHLSPSAALRTAAAAGAGTPTCAAWSPADRPPKLLVGSSAGTVVEVDVATILADVADEGAPGPVGLRKFSFPPPAVQEARDPGQAAAAGDAAGDAAPPDAAHPDAQGAGAESIGPASLVAEAAGSSAGPARMCRQLDSPCAGLAVVWVGYVQAQTPQDDCFHLAAAASSGGSTHAGLWECRWNAGEESVRRISSDALCVADRAAGGRLELSGESASIGRGEE